MAEFIIGNPLRKVAREHKLLRQLLWRIDYALVWVIQKLMRALPVDTSSRLGERLGAFIGPRMKNKTAIFRENLAIAFPALSAAELDRLVRRAWGRAGRVLAEYPHLETILREPERLQIELREPLATCRHPERPCVVVSAHLGNWEVVCSAMAKLGMPNASLYSPPTNPLLDRLLLESRRALNCELLPRDNSARSLVRAMKAGRTAGMVMDRRVDDGTPVRFFGYDKPSTLIPAKLALKFGCDLVPAQVVRLGDARFRVIFHPPIRPDADGGVETALAPDKIQRLHAQFESWIRQQPEDWFCSKRLWAKGTLQQLEESGGNAGVGNHGS